MAGQSIIIHGHGAVEPVSEGPLGISGVLRGNFTGGA